jgi:hypothetical protein
MDIPFEKVAFAATIVYVVGILVFSIMFNIFDITKKITGLVGGTSNLGIINQLKIAPWILSLFYFSFVFSIIFYLTYKTHQKKKEEKSSGQM